MEDGHEQQSLTENKMIEMGTWYAPLTKETPLSKYFSLALFIFLPFLGFWFGVEYKFGFIMFKYNIH